MYNSYPSRLLSNEDTVSKVLSSQCNDCEFIHRIGSDQSLYTIGNEIDPEVINFGRFCGLSNNIKFCKDTDDCYHVSFVDDVKFKIKGENKKALEAPFDSGDNIPKLESIQFEFDETLNLIGFRKRDMESLKGVYPWSKKQQNEPIPEDYRFYVKLEYCPNSINVFHFQLEIYGNHRSKGEKFEKFKGRLSSNSKPEYLNSIIGKIKNIIIRDRLLFPVTST